MRALRDEGELRGAVKKVDAHSAELAR